MSSTSRRLFSFSPRVPGRLAPNKPIVDIAARGTLRERRSSCLARCCPTSSSNSDSHVNLHSRRKIRRPPSYGLPARKPSGYTQKSRKFRAEHIWTQFRGGARPSGAIGRRRQARHRTARFCFGVVFRLHCRTSVRIPAGLEGATRENISLRSWRSCTFPSRLAYPDTPMPELQRVRSGPAASIELSASIRGRIDARDTRLREDGQARPRKASKKRSRAMIASGALPQLGRRRHQWFALDAAVLVMAGSAVCGT